MDLKEGITHVIDRGLGPRAAQDLVDVAGPLISVIKLGWGTALVTRNLERKLGIYRQAGIPVCFGGTAFEAAFLRGNVDELVELALGLGLQVFEVSDGTVPMDQQVKLDWISRLARQFTVFSEVGGKEIDGQRDVDLCWSGSARDELNAGATKVILETRESGTAGISDERGFLRYRLIEEIIECVGLENLIFEAPQKQQQVCLIKWFGAKVNLGNIAPDDVIPLETLRRGLRADTLMHFHGAE